MLRDSKDYVSSYKQRLDTVKSRKEGAYCGGRWIYFLLNEFGQNQIWSKQTFNKSFRFSSKSDLNGHQICFDQLVFFVCLFSS